MRSLVGVLAGSGRLPAESRDGVWFDAAQADSVDTQLYAPLTRQMVAGWHAVRDDLTPATPAAMRPQNGQLADSATAVPSGIDFEMANAQLFCIQTAVDFAGPLSIYAAVSSRSPPSVNDYPRLLYLESTVLGSDVRLFLGWEQPLFLMTIPDPYRRRTLRAPPEVDWRGPLGTTRIVALSLPGACAGGTPKWFFGNNRWLRGVEELPTVTGGGAPPTMLPANIRVGGPSANGMVVHELRLIPAYHRDETVAAVFHELAVKWAATV